MKRLFLKEDYKPLMSVKETEKAIKFVRDSFERRVSFDVKNIAEEVEVVQSLAKWKRNALGKYGFLPGEGLYTNMNAIRRDEDLDTMHSCYVDQWDWEKVIERKDRTKGYLKKTVKQIYSVLKSLASKVEKEYPMIKHDLPDEITFITTKELEEMYPDLEPNRREYEICKEKKAVFLMQIGGKLKNGLPHDGRASDYDDWKLNGDILLYYDVLDIAFEVSSMGIRVDADSLYEQMKEKKELDKINDQYHQDVLNDRLPLTIGGGIGQSRLCMFMLKKAHIGEVQASIWPEEDIKALEKCNIHLL